MIFPIDSTRTQTTEKSSHYSRSIRERKNQMYTYEPCQLPPFFRFSPTGKNVGDLGSRANRCFLPHVPFWKPGGIDYPIILEQEPSLIYIRDTRICICMYIRYIYIYIYRTLFRSRLHMHGAAALRCTHVSHRVIYHRA